MELPGLRILVVEDEMLVAMLLEDMLTSLGCQVIGPVGSVSSALRLVDSERLEAAVLDVNLGSEMVYPVADVLEAARIPYVFITGYGPTGLAGVYRDHPTIQKPFHPDRFGDDLLESFSRAGA
jgi:CheY-like chemotaxis protein